MSYATPQEPQGPHVTFAIWALAMMLLLCFWPYALRGALNIMRPKHQVEMSDPFLNPKYLVNPQPVDR